MQQKSLVVQTKLTPLRPSQRVLHRPRLTQRILEALSHRLTVLQAGAGYGKSTALSTLVESEYAIVWYHLEPEDTDPPMFLLYLLHGFLKTLPALSQKPLAALETWQSIPDMAPRLAAIDMLINELAEETHEPILLVLDDAHLLNQAPASLHILERLIKYAPDHLHIILSTRQSLRLDCLVALRVRGELLEIGEAEMAFTRDEIRAFFQDQHRLPLSASDVEVLATETEGWAIALQLIRQGLAASALTSLPQVLHSVSGLKEDLFSYLAQEVLDQQPEDIRNFLLTTCILRRMTPAACDSLRDAHDSRQLLSTLTDAGLFVVALDESTLRYHHLFHDFLYHQLPDGEKRALHRRAAALFSGQGESEEAIYHWIRSGDAEQAAELIKQVGQALVQAGRLETLADWITSLPPETLEKQPILLIYQGDIARLRSRFDEALRWYRQAEGLCRARSDIEGTARALRGQARVYLDTVNPNHAEPLLREALRLSDGQEDRESRARLLELLAENQLNRGHAEEARKLQEQVRELREEGPGEADLAVRVLLRTGRLDEARRLLEERVEAEHQQPVLRPRAHRETLLLLSLIVAFQGEGEVAYQAAVEGTQRGQALDSPFVTAVGYMRQGHAWLIREADHRYDEAQRCFERAIEISDRLAVSRLKVEAFWGLCRAFGYAGNLSRAERMAEQGIEIAQRAGDEWIIAHIRATLAASYTLAGHTDEAIAWLAQAERGFRECSDTFGEAAVRLWQCLTWRNLKEETRLRHHLDSLFQLVSAHGYDYLLTRRTLVGPPDVRHLVVLLLSARAQGRHAAYAGDLLRQMKLGDLELHPGYQLRVQMLGPFRVWRGEAEIEGSEWRREKARQLFQLLLTWRGAMLDRDRICDLLWPELSSRAASQGFKVALSALYYVLEPRRGRRDESAYVARDGSLYGLRPQADLWLDVDEFERLIRAGDARFSTEPARSVEDYRQALALYRGDYLEEYPYEEWCKEERTRLRELYLRTADRLARVLVERGDWEQAIEVCQGILMRDDCWENAYRLVMICYARLGNRPQALRTYQRAVERLREVLNIQPSPETSALYRAILETGSV